VRSGSNLFVANRSGDIGEYTVFGTTVSAVLITEATVGIALSGGDLFVTNQSSGTIGEYTTSGMTVNATLVSGLDTPTGIAVSDGNLFVTNFVAGTIGEYTTSGETVNAALISGLDFPVGITISTFSTIGPGVPEASTWVMALTGFAALGFAGIRRARSRPVSA
jgi:hypothetical protein